MLDSSPTYLCYGPLPKGLSDASQGTCIEMAHGANQALVDALVDALTSGNPLCAVAPLPPQDKGLPYQRRRRILAAQKPWIECLQAYVRSQGQLPKMRQLIAIAAETRPDLALGSVSFALAFPPQGRRSSLSLACDLANLPRLEDCLDKSTS